MARVVHVEGDDGSNRTKIALDNNLKVRPHTIELLAGRLQPTLCQDLHLSLESSRPGPSKKMAAVTAGALGRRKLLIKVRCKHFLIFKSVI